MDDFIASAIDALPHQAFDQEKPQAAVARIRNLQKCVRLDLQGMSLRELAKAFVLGLPRGAETRL